MQLDDLPRLSDADREALDTGLIAMEGVQAFTIDDLVAQRTAALYAMRTAGSDWASFSAASKHEAELAAQIRLRRQRGGVTMFALLALCALNVLGFLAVVVWQVAAALFA